MKIDLDVETEDRLIADASAHLRPPDLHALALLRRALKLPVPRVKRLPEMSAELAESEGHRGS